MPRLADVIAVLDAAYDPAWAEEWDAVGLVCGDPDAPVEHVLLAVDPAPAVAAQAREVQAQLVLTHHPLFLRGVHGVPATTYKGRLVHDLIRSGTALFAAHTNADVARPGVSDALAEAVGIRHAVPLRKGPADGLGLGRVGVLEQPMRLADFAERAAAALPRTEQGLRWAGDPDRMVETAAVCGGAGDSLLADAVTAGADVYLTADLRHHPASEHAEAAAYGDGPALLDAAHWATEHPWLRSAAALLEREAGVRTTVSALRTDPWTGRTG